MNKVLLRGFLLCVSASVWAGNAFNDAVFSKHVRALEAAISADIAAIQNKFDPSGSFVPTSVKTIKTIFYGPQGITDLLKELATASRDSIAQCVKRIEALNNKLAEDPLRSLPRGVNSSYLAAWEAFKRDAVPYLLQKASSRGSSGSSAPRPQPAPKPQKPSDMPQTDDEQYVAFVLSGNATKAQVLGLTEEEYGDESVRRSAYFRLIRKWHPDKNPGRVELATQIAQKLNEALSGGSSAPRPQPAPKPQKPSDMPSTDDERYAAFVLSGKATKAQVLGLTEAEYRDESVRRSAYKRLILKWHPDKNPERIELAQQITQKLNWAYGK